MIFSPWLFVLGSSFLRFFSIYIHIIICTSTSLLSILFYINSLVINFFSSLYILFQTLSKRNLTLYHPSHIIFLYLLYIFLFCFKIAQKLPMVVVVVVVIIIISKTFYLATYELNVTLCTLYRHIIITNLPFVRVSHHNIPTSIIILLYSNTLWPDHISWTFNTKLLINLILLQHYTCTCNLI